MLTLLSGIVSVLYTNRYFACCSIALKTFVNPTFCRFKLILSWALIPAKDCIEKKHNRITLNFAHNKYLTGSTTLPNETYRVFFFMLKQIRWLIAQPGI